jgi:hypothetical protein
VTAISLPVLLALASEGGRVCPQPHAWTRLYALLPDTRSDGYGAIPAAPYVLAAWAETSDEQKILRLREHLEWAERHGALAAVHAFLSSLPEADWHHVGG